MTHHNHVPLTEALKTAPVFVDGDWIESKDQDPNGDVRLIQLADIGVGTFINKSQRYLTTDTAQRLGCTFLKRGDVLIARMPDPIGRACIFPGVGQPAVTAVDVCIARVDPAVIDSSFLVHFLNSSTALRQVSSKASGSTRQRISRSNLGSIEIPLPPMEEQRRIAAILDKSAAIKSCFEQRQRLMDGFMDSMLSHDFGSPAKWPLKWEMQRLGDCCECLDKHRKPIKESERNHGSVPYFGANGQQGWIDDFLFDESLVLVAEDGGHFHDRKRGVAYRIDGKSWVNNHAHILRPKSGALDIEFLHRILRHYDFTPYISGSTRSKLTQGQLNEVLIPVPPFEKQRSFADRAARAVLESAKAARSLQLADSLLQSLKQSILGR